MSGDKVFVIAEAGVNHNGDIELARELVRVAARSGADAVKFQTFKADLLVDRAAPTAEYQRNHGAGDSQYQMLKALELSEEDHKILKHEAEVHKIEFMSTPFDEESAGFLNSLGVVRFKISSGDINNFNLLKTVAGFGLPVIFSTGMADGSEVVQCFELLKRSGLAPDKISVLHCNTEYPTPFCDVNLRAMQTMGRDLGISYGYSDHTKGDEVSLAAVALGATLIEKHFTLSRLMKGPDHAASLEPEELKSLVQKIRHVSEALGSYTKIVTESEFKNKIVARKSLVAKKAIQKGDFFTAENLTAKRPGQGLSPMRWEALVGTTAKKNYNPNEMIEE